MNQRYGKNTTLVTDLEGNIVDPALVLDTNDKWHVGK